MGQLIYIYIFYIVFIDTVVQMQKSSQDVIETENMVKICALLSNPVLTDIALTFSSTSITANGTVLSL